MTPYQCAHEAAAWRDMSHFGRFRVAGADAAALLHHLTTNDIKKLKPGEGCDAALATSKARLLDIAIVFRLPATGGPAFLVLTSPNRREQFKPHAQKFIVYRQDVSIEDLTAAGAWLGLFGPHAASLLPGAPEVADLPTNKLLSIPFAGAQVSIARTHRLPGGGFFVWGDADIKAWLAAGAAPEIDGDTYNTLRVEWGIPAAGFEITEDINPWEAGLGAMVSLHKGCYNGQEVVARLNTYKKVKQQLRGLKLAQPIAMGQRRKVQLAGRDVGFVTSSVVSPRLGPIALAYLRNAAAEPGAVVQVEGEGEASPSPQDAVVVELPFAM